jgi:hypothetical protein
MKKLLEAELLKLKHSNILALIMFLPLFFVALGFTNFIRYKELFTEKGQNIWQQIYTQSAMFYGLFILSLFVTIVMAIIVRIENSENNFRRILTLSVKRKEIYLAKFLVGAGIVFLNLFGFMLMVIAAGSILAGTSKMPLGIVYGPLLAFVALIPVMAIQYYLSMRFSNIGVALGIGAVFSIPSVLISNTKFWIFFPWTYSGRAILSGANVNPFETGWYMYAIGIVIALLFTLRGMYEFSEKDIV